MDEAEYDVKKYYADPARCYSPRPILPPKIWKKFEFNKYFIIHLKIFHDNAYLDRCVFFK